MRHDKDKLRAARRAATARHGRAQLRLRRRHVTRGDGWAEATPHWFARASALGCDCRKRRHGRPKVGRGCCPSSLRPRPALGARRASRRLRQEWAAWD